jgi:hypothetical protein
MELVTNLNVYLAIAEEALAESERLAKLARTPKPDGKRGFVVQFDPKRGSFKNSLIAIVFSAIYLEALFYIEGVRRLGTKGYDTYDHRKYEVKLKRFGLSDPKLLAEAKHFRETRNDIVHERATEMSNMTQNKILSAQDEARKAIAFVKHVAASLH